DLAPPPPLLGEKDNLKSPKFGGFRGRYSNSKHKYDLAVTQYLRYAMTNATLSLTATPKELIINLSIRQISAP
ncbi:MAG: hypothetical protein AAFX80_10630, partial [Cyanobacteria bacterium J06639_18]